MFLVVGRRVSILRDLPPDARGDPSIKIVETSARILGRPRSAPTIVLLPHLEESMHGIAGVVAESGWRDRTFDNRIRAIVQLRGAHQRIGRIRQVRGISAIRYRKKIKGGDRKIEGLTGSSSRKQGLVGGKQPAIAAKRYACRIFPEHAEQLRQRAGRGRQRIERGTRLRQCGKRTGYRRSRLVCVLVSRLSLQRLCCIQPGRASLIDDPLRQQIPHRLPRGRDVGREDIVEAAIFADHDNQMFDRGGGGADAGGLRYGCNRSKHVDRHGAERHP
jgi:hypothetical protein